MWLRAPELAVLTLGIAGLTFIHSQPLLTWAYVDAVAASAEYRQSLTLAGTLAASAAAWVGSKVSSPRVAFCPPGARRRGYSIALRHVAEVASAAIGGMVLGLLPVTAWAITGTAVDDLEFGVIVSGLAALLTFIAAGYLLGAILPSLLAVPLAAAGAFVWVIFTGNDGQIGSPIWPFDVEAGLHEPSEVTSLRIAYFLTIAGLLVSAAGWWLREHNIRLGPNLPFGMAMFLIPCLVMTIVVNSREENVIQRATPTSSCVLTESGVQVCVHSAREVLLKDLSRQVEQIIGVLGPRATAISEVTDATLWRENTPERINLQLQARTNHWLTTAEADIAAAIAGLPACYEAGPSDIETRAASAAVAAWLLSQIDADPAAVLGTNGAAEAVSRLNSRPAAEVKEHILENIDEFRSCTGSLGQL